MAFDFFTGRLKEFFAKQGKGGQAHFNEPNLASSQAEQNDQSNQAGQSNQSSQHEPCCTGKVHIFYRGVSDDHLYVARQRSWSEVKFFRPRGLRVFCQDCRRRLL